MSDQPPKRPGPPKCGGTNRQGNPCGKPAGFGTDHPGFGNCKHHGGSSPSGRVAAAKEEATVRAAELGAEAPVDAAEALEYAVRLIAGQVAWLQEQVKRFEEAPDGGMGRAGLAKALEHAAERLAKTAKIAIDAGVEERRLALDEALLDRLAGALRNALSEVELTQEQTEQLADAMRRNLAGLDGVDWRRPRELTP